MDLMPTGAALMLRVQASSQGAGQMRPVNSGNDVVHRAAAVAEGNAAVHAAGALDGGLLVGQVQHELLVVLDPAVHRVVGLGEAFKFHETRGLAHSYAASS
jgi:hypothetical protein